MNPLSFLLLREMLGLLSKVVRHIDFGTYLAALTHQGCCGWWLFFFLSIYLAYCIFNRGPSGIGNL